MAFTMEYTSTHQDTTYALTVSTLDGGGMTVALTGAAETGDQVAEGALRLPPGGATEAARLLHQALTAMATLEGRRRPRRAGSAPNSHAPWTPDQDAALREDWLAHPATTPSSAAIRELAAARQRSPAAIRARLARIGCDPDVPGRLLTEEAAALLGRDATAAPPG